MTTMDNPGKKQQLGHQHD